MLERIPANRLGSVEDVAALVGFLCSEHSGFITGETIQVNGGMYLS
jgi:NAD(P)-dependent dehydrogenase (short-subunit alcohol dehydrogenase family)